jgi:beta-galactosidase
MKIFRINDNWLFTKRNDPAFQREELKEAVTITLPHSWNASDGQTGGKEYFRGICWYQRKLNVSEKDIARSIFLEIGAAGLVSEVYVNGHFAGGSNCGYAMYRIAINSFLVPGENLLSIMVDNTSHEDVYPLMADFTFYGGLYREVKLIVAEPVHFDLLDSGRDGIYLTQAYIGGNTYDLKIDGTIINEKPSANSKAKLKFTLLDKDEKAVFRKEMDLEAADEMKFHFTEKIKNVISWHGTENPYLYTLKAELFCDETLYDERNIEIGFRNIVVTADRGLLLNGKPLKLNGVSRHQDFAGVGNAILKEHMELDMAIIKEMGANSIRLAHYQHDDFFYHLCDRAGMLVWAEIPFISIPTVADDSNQNAKEQLVRLIKQAYNHSSIYCWGVQNEITIAMENERIHELVMELVQMVKELDPGRLTAQANVYSVADESPLNEMTDIVGYNLYYGWYYGEMHELGKRLDEFHKARPNIPVLVSEYGVDTNPKLHSYNPAVRDYTEEYQLLFDNNAIRTFRERPFVLGGYHWNMFDFGSAMRNEGGESGKNQKGLVTLDRKLKKDAFYLYKANWSEESFIYLAGRRFANRHEVLNDIVALTNLERVKLFVNQDFIGEIHNQEPIKTFAKVRLSLGKNCIKAEGYDKEGFVYTDEMILNHSEAMDKSYILEKTEEQRHVINWFEKFDLTNVQEVTLKEGYYSTFDSIKTLYANEAAKAVFEKYFGEMAEQPRFKAMIMLMSIDSMSKITQFNIPKELLAVINKELNCIPK